eukprot:Seg129.4 transcript_id=Seg129.4/GoldUCD/mRNA.D3Y31 product="Zinc metalloproteinase nas-13" protein_id=Seg129.4/GoldUCD/D3Y31
MGMSEGKSQISVGEGCGYRRVISHEIGHVVGFFHEQSRVDRDEYVDINWWNIKEDMERSFNKYTGNSIDSRGIPYDYGSIMHYPWHAMSINGKDTIVPKKTVVNQPYQKLSQLDAAQTNLMYKEMCQRGEVKDSLLMILRGSQSRLSCYLKVVFSLNSLCLAFHSAHKGSWLTMGL